MPVPRGGRCCCVVFWGQPKQPCQGMQKEGGRGVNPHLHSAGRFQAGLDPALCTAISALLLTPGSLHFHHHIKQTLFAPHPLHVKPISTPSSPFFCTLLKDSDCQYQRDDGGATCSPCCSLLALCPFPSPQAPTVPSGFCSLPETFIT